MKTFIDNRAGKKVCVIVEGSDEAGKLAFVMHGLGSTKDRPQIRVMIAAFVESGYTVVSFDTTNTFGESEGDYQDATTTNYYADLQDVIDWASKQPWYVEPFVLCGHSLGGISTAMYAEKYPEKVKAIAPIATVVSGKLSFDAYEMFGNQKELEQWERDGIIISTSFDGKRVKRLKWSHMEDRLQYDLLPHVDKLKMPVLLVAGENDTVTPLLHQQILYEKLSGPKEIHEIKGALHSFYEPHEQQELKAIVKRWLTTF